MSSRGESEISLVGKVEEPDDKSIKEVTKIVIAVDHGETSQTLTLDEALDTIRETIIDSATSPNSKLTKIEIKHMMTEKIEIDMTRSPNRPQIIQTPSDKQERIAYPSPVSDWLDKEGHGVSSSSSREIPENISDSSKEIPDDGSDSIRKIVTTVITKIPVDRPKSGRKVPDIGSSDSEDRTKRIRPCDKQKEQIEEEVPDSTQMMKSNITNHDYELDVDMCSVGTGPDPDEVAELEPVDRPKSGRKVPDISISEERPESEDRNERVSPCDKQKEEVEEVPDSTQIMKSTITNHDYELDVDMCSVGTGPDPEEVTELEPVEDMQTDFD